MPFEKKLISLHKGGLDKLYSITSSPMGIASPELIKNARIALLMAVILWYLNHSLLSLPFWGR
jgi:hypothetical protein